MLSGIVKCPICGTGMYGNKSIKKRKDGTKYKDFYYYGCKHRNMTRGHKCDYKKQINEEVLDAAVAEVIVKLVSNPKFAKMMQSKINTKVDVKPINQEIANYKKQLKQANMAKDRIIEEIDSMDAEDRHFEIRKKDLNDRLNKMYDKIEESSDMLATALNKKRSIEADKLTLDNIYKVLICFEKLYDKMDQTEKRQLVSALVDKVEIYEEKRENGQWLKSITFKLPIIEGRERISLDNSDRVETVCLLSRKEPN